MSFSRSSGNYHEKARLLDINSTPPIKKRQFSVFHRLYFPFSAGIVIFCIGSILAGFGQQISLPVYLSTFGQYAGAYFVLWMCSFCFAILFGICAAVLICRGTVTREMREWRWYPYMLLVGLFDAMNGVLAVYSAFLGRVPGALQSVLLQAYIPVTLVFSKIMLRKKYSLVQMIGASLVMAGIVVSLVPTFESMHQSSQNTQVQGWWWPLISVLSTFPGALMSIVQEKMQDKFRAEAKDDKRYSVFYFQFVESFFQWMWLTFFFWTDLIPGFGVSGSIDVFWSTFTFNFKCFFGISSAIELNDRCEYTGIIGLLFIVAYMTSYIFGTLLTLYASANLGSVVGSIAPVLTIIFWFSCPALNNWAGGAPYTLNTIIFNVIGIVVILPGVYLYRRNEQEDKSPDEDEGNVELCFRHT